MAECSLSTGRYLRPARLRQLHHQGAGNDQRLLVCQRDDLAGFERRPGSTQADCAHDRAYDPVGLRVLHHLDQSVESGKHPDPRSAQGSFELTRCRLFGQRDKARPQRARLLGQLLPSLVRRESPGRKPFAAVVLDHVERAAADRAGRAQHNHVSRPIAARRRLRQHDPWFSERLWHVSYQASGEK